MSRKHIPATPSTQCQKCLKYGHRIYECKNERPYVFRPSASQRFVHPDLQDPFNQDKGPKGPRVTDGDWKRTTYQESSSEEEVALPVKHQREGDEVDSDSDSSSDSSEAGESSFDSGQ